MRLLILSIMLSQRTWICVIKANRSLHRGQREIRKYGSYDLCTTTHQHIELPYAPDAFLVQNIDFQQDNHIYNSVSIIIPPQSPSLFVLIEKKNLFYKDILLTLTEVFRVGLAVLTM